MIKVTYDQKMLDDIKKKLGGMKDEAPKVLKYAVNQTAKQVRKDIASQAQKTYTVKVGGFNKAMKIKNATAGNLEATIKATGEPLPLKDFRYSQTRGSLKAKVLKSGSMKTLQISGNKAFVGNVADKNQRRKKDTAKGKKGSIVRHIAIAQRKTKDRLPIKTLYSNSIPVMLGSEKRVYGVVEPKIQEYLKENTEKQIRKVLGE